MNVTIVAVGKLRESYLRAGCDLYVTRLAPYFHVNVVEIRQSSGVDGLAAQGREIVRRAGEGTQLWALDRSGSPLSSIALANKISDVERSGCRLLALALGGAEGLHRGVLDRAAFVWSLSDLTFLHEMARLIALEQLYRAAKIQRGEPYHR